MKRVPRLGRLVRLALPHAFELDPVRVVLQGPDAPAALERLIAESMSSSDARLRLAGFYPLFGAVLLSGGHDLPSAFAARLRVALIHERARCEAIAAIAGRAFAALDAAGISPTLVGGCAFAAHYPDPAHRHCHDLDLLVDDPAQAIRALAEAGFEPGTDRNHPHCVRDRSGFPLVLHRPDGVPLQTTMADTWLGRCRLGEAAALVGRRCSDIVDGGPRARRALVDVAVLARNLEASKLATACAAQGSSLATWAVLDLLNELGLDRPDLTDILADRAEPASPVQLLLRAVHTRRQRPLDLLAAASPIRDLPAILLAGARLARRRPGAAFRRLAAWLRPA
ncbi:MAG: nucleotidyltransferase family protein [Geminicoccaceae bacterium]